MNKEAQYSAGIALMEAFCAANAIPVPEVVRLGRNDRLYHLATCAFYRGGKITIMVEKCASNGFGGRAWSWPGYTVDRTPYGVIQHELAHHIDYEFSTWPLKVKSDLFSFRIHEQSGEKPLTGYLGTDKKEQTFYMEWFAEILRLFVTNPDLCRLLRPRFYRAVVGAGLKPIATGTWEQVLARHAATLRIVDQTRKKIESAGDDLVHFEQQIMGEFWDAAEAPK